MVLCDFSDRNFDTKIKLQPLKSIPNYYWGYTAELSGVKPLYGTIDCDKDLVMSIAIVKEIVDKKIGNASYQKLYRSIGHCLKLEKTIHSVWIEKPSKRTHW